MKKINYIFKNIDIKKFMKKLDKPKGDLLINLVDNIYRCTPKLKLKDDFDRTDDDVDFDDMLMELIKDSLFFSKFKEFDVFFYALSNEIEKTYEFEGEKIKAPTGFYECYCFYSKLDKKYRFIDIYTDRNTFSNDNYRISFFNKKPTNEKLFSIMQDKNSHQTTIPRLGKVFKKYHGKSLNKEL